MELSKIQVGDRVRRRIGDLSELKTSIKAVGLLQPLVLDGDRKLVAGWRRLRALKELGHTEAPVVIVERLKDARLHLLAERDENTCREDMDGFEEMEMTRRLLALEKPKAKERQRQSEGRGKKRSETVSDLNAEPEGEALQQVASAVGVSAPSIRKGLAAAEAYARNPKKYKAVKPALEARQWSKAARAVRQADDPAPSVRKPTPKEKLECELRAIEDRLDKLWQAHPRHRDIIISRIGAHVQMFRSMLKAAKR